MVFGSDACDAPAVPNGLPGMTHAQLLTDRSKPCVVNTGNHKTQGRPRYLKVAKARSAENIATVGSDGGRTGVIKSENVVRAHLEQSSAGSHGRSVGLV